MVGFNIKRDQRSVQATAVTHSRWFAQSIPCFIMDSLTPAFIALRGLGSLGSSGPFQPLQKSEWHPVSTAGHWTHVLRKGMNLKSLRGVSWPSGWKQQEGRGRPFRKCQLEVGWERGAWPEEWGTWSSGAVNVGLCVREGGERKGKDYVKGLSMSGAGGQGRGDWEGAAPAPWCAEAHS